MNTDSTTTKSGKFVIYHVDACPFVLYPGAPVTADHLKEVKRGGPWFFRPAEADGTARLRLRGYPLAYSAGFRTVQDALEFAEFWESEFPQTGT